MRLLILGIILSLLIGSLGSDFARAQTPPLQLPRNPSESDLANRFNELLDQELSGKNVCIEPSAARALEALMKEGAARVLQEKALSREPESELNIKSFGKSLLLRGITTDGQIRITTSTISALMAEKIEGFYSPLCFCGGGGWSFCPLFPICK